MDVSFIDDITRVAASWTTPGVGRDSAAPTTGSTPGASSSADAAISRLGTVFQSTFRRDMATVFERGAAGEFDDPHIAMQISALEARLAQGTPRSIPLPGRRANDGTPARGPVTGGGPAGSDAAPDAADVAPTGGPGSAGSPDADTVALHDLRIRQAEARVANVSATLRRDLPKGAEMASAATGTWDPATFQPRTRAQAEAFAQRMVIDATEAAARLDVVKTQLDKARFEAGPSPSGAAAARIAQLEELFARQYAYVGKLAAIVDRSADGEVSDVGAQVLDGGTSVRGADDLQAEELARELRAQGVDEERIRLIVGAEELAIEQDVIPGGSPRLQSLARSMATRIWMDMERRRAERREVEQERQLERRLDEKRLEARAIEHRSAERAADQQAVNRAHEARTQGEQAARQRQAIRQQQFDAFLQSVAAADQQRRQAG